MVQRDISDSLIVRPDCFGNLYGHGCGCGDWRCTGVNGDEKRDACASKIVSVAEQQSHMPMSATATRGIHSPRVGVQLVLKQLECGIGRSALNQSEGGVGKIEVGCGGRHGSKSGLNQHNEPFVD